MRRPLQTHHRNNYQLNLVYLIKRIQSLNIQVGAVPRATVGAGTQNVSAYTTFPTRERNCPWQPREGISCRRLLQVSAAGRPWGAPRGPGRDGEGLFIDLSGGELVRRSGSAPAGLPGVSEPWGLLVR